MLIALRKLMGYIVGLVIAALLFGAVTERLPKSLLAGFVGGTLLAIIAVALHLYTIEREHRG